MPPPERPDDYQNELEELVEEKDAVESEAEPEEQHAGSEEPSLALELPDPAEPAKRLQNLRRAAKDLNARPELVSAVSRLRSRLPGDERFGDRLSTTGTEPASRVARGVTAFQPDRPSAAHELGLSALQVWQALSEKSGRGRGDRPLAILFTDLVEFSSWALEAGDTAVISLLRDAGTVIESAIEERDGRIVKRLGDGLMAVFLHPQPAVDAVLDANELLATIEVQGYVPKMRAGIHYGQPRKLGNDYLGVDVNIAARVGESAKAQQLLVSEPTFDLLHTEGLKFSRAKRLKAAGAPRELRVREVGRA